MGFAGTHGNRWVGKRKDKRARGAEILVPGGHVVTHSLEKWICCTQIVVFVMLCLTLYNPIDCRPHQAPWSMGFPRQEY